MKPKRVQRSRLERPGIPNGAVYVGRPSQWGNPAKIGEWFLISWLNEPEKVFIHDNPEAVLLFFWYCIDMAEKNPAEFIAWLLPLVGRDLCCWCGPNDICHADVLLYFANTCYDDPENPGAFRIPEKWPSFEDFLERRPIFQ